MFMNGNISALLKYCNELIVDNITSPFVQNVLQNVEVLCMHDNQSAKYSTPMEFADEKK